MPPEPKIRSTQRLPKRRETVIYRGRIVTGSPPPINAPPPSWEELNAEAARLRRENEELKVQLSKKFKEGTPKKGLRTSATVDSINGHTPDRIFSGESSVGDDHEYTSDAPGNPTSTNAALSNELGRMAAQLGFLSDESIPSFADLDESDYPPVEPSSGTLRPSAELSSLLINFALTEMGWLIAIVPPSFQHEHDTLWRTTSFDLLEMNRTKPAWTALYLSLLSYALVYVRKERAASWGVMEEFKWLLARSWFDAAVKLMFDGARCLMKPNLVYLQVYCVLTLVTQPFNCALLHDTMLAAMLRLGYALGLHRLKRSNSPRTPVSETGRRVWAFLLGREAKYVPEKLRFKGINLNEPEPFATFINVDDEAWFRTKNLVQLPWSHPTRLSYMQAQCRIATFLSETNQTIPPPYEAVLQLDDRLQHLLDDMPYFQQGAKHLPEYPAWLPVARHVLSLHISQKRLLILRHYFTLSASNEAYASSRILSVKAAFDIAAERRLHDFPFDDKLDTLNHVLPAAIVLLLDILYPLPGKVVTDQDVQERCLEVEVLLSPLRSLAVSGRQTTEVANTFKAVDNLLLSTFTMVQRRQQQKPTQDPEPVIQPQPAQTNMAQVKKEEDPAIPSILTMTNGSIPPTSSVLGNGGGIVAGSVNDASHNISFLQDSANGLIPDQGFTEMLKELGFDSMLSYSPTEYPKHDGLSLSPVNQWQEMHLAENGPPPDFSWLAQYK